jgi:Flp pilus assembly protein TadG
MALVTFLLVLLLAGIVDLGRAFHTYIVITNAAREGARYGSRAPHLANEIKAAAEREAALSGVTLDTNKITISPPPPDGAEPWWPEVAQPGEPIQVTIAYEFSTTMGGILNVGTLTLSNMARMRVFGTDHFDSG